MARYRTVLEVEDGSQLSDGVGGARHWEAKTFFVCDLLTDLPLPSSVDKGSMAFVLEDQSRWYTQDSIWNEETATAVGSIAPGDATYLTLSANATLSNETVVGSTPGGELGGTWASPTVDSSHAGSTHAAAASSAVSTHEGLADPHPLYSLDTDLTTHAGAADPHTGYRLESADHTHAATGIQGGTLTDAALTGTPGGELGGTFQSFTVDATHSGSSHAATQAAAEATAAAANTADIATHAGLADPHTGYRLESADHTHASTGIQGGTIAHSVTTGITATDHHAAPAAGPDANVTVDSAGAAGTASTFARSGHGHQVVTYSSAAAAVGTAAAGTSAQAPARGDHVHPTGAGTPSTQAFADAAAVGSGPAAAMTDHKHAMPAAPTAASVGAAATSHAHVEADTTSLVTDLAARALSADIEAEVTEAEWRLDTDAVIAGNVTFPRGDQDFQGQFSPDLVIIPNNYWRLHYLDLQLNNDLLMEGSSELVLFDFLPHGDITLA